MTLALAIGTPVLVVGVLVGLVVGVFQSATQIQDQTISFVCKIAAMFVTLAIFLPWIISRTVEFTRELLTNIPETATIFLN